MSPFSGKCVWMVLGVALWAGVGESRAALSASEVCQLRKVKEVSRFSKCVLKAEVREVRSGSPAAIQDCFARIEEQFALGCDGVILHGATPQELAPVVEAYRRSRG